MSAATFDPQRRLAEVLAVHFDPSSGTPYWLERAAELGFDPRREIKTVADLPRLGLMDEEAMRRRPLLDFVPYSVQHRPQDLLVVQTGGTLGRPLWTAYTERDYAAAFVTPFLVAARHVGFPPGGTWLYVGPSGPHVIGRAAESLARATGAPAPFTVDFDVRWAQKLSAGSFALRRYLEHVVAQAVEIIATQPVDKLFTTPTVLAALAARMTPDQRARIRGVHYGGMALSPSDLQRFQTELFPEAVHLSGYGNTLFGCCLELDVTAGRQLHYFPYGDRLVLGVLDAENNNAPRYETGGVSNGTRFGVENQSRDRKGADVHNHAQHISAHGHLEGRLVFTRLDSSLLLVNVVERDRVRLVAPPKGAPEGFAMFGAANPHPWTEQNRPTTPSLY